MSTLKKVLRPSRRPRLFYTVASINRNPFLSPPNITRSQKVFKPHNSSSTSCRRPKLSSSQLSKIYFPHFPTKKYNLILCDAPWHYHQITPITPFYRTLTFQQLKLLPISSISSPDCVFLYWTTGPMLYQALNLAKHYGFRHLTVLHVWRKLDALGNPHKSSTHSATLTQPNMEFLIIAYKGYYKHLLNPHIPSLHQELSSRVQGHSQKPSKVYSTIETIFNVHSFPCLELFARCKSHPYFDVYGDQVPNYFQSKTSNISSITSLPSSSHPPSTSLPFPPSSSPSSNLSRTSLTPLTSLQLPPTPPTPQERGVTMSSFPPYLASKLSTLSEHISFSGQYFVQALTFLSQYVDLFAWSSHEVGKMSNIYHKIRLFPNSQPKAFKPYRLSAIDRTFVEQEISELLRLGYIERCSSPWAAPVVVVPKDGGGKRLVIDFRYLNKCTIKEHWPLPNFEDFLTYLPKALFMSKLDLRSGFFNQCFASLQDEEYASFVCHLGQFKCKRLWFGLSNAPSSFQRGIMDALGSLVFHCCLVYIDDILIFSESFDQHLLHLEKVLNCLAAANVKLHPQKCQFFTYKCTFLGHTISNGTISPKLKRYNLLQHMNAPSTKTQLKSFLGLISYYRRFIPFFSSIAQPLTSLLSKDVPYTWSSSQQDAFLSLRSQILSLPTLYLPKPNLPFTLATDFSSRGLGAVLSQVHDGQDLPIAFISRTLTKHEKNYSSYEGEVLAVVFALQKLRHYLLGQQFTLYTDNKALHYILKASSPSPKINRWLLFLSEYDFIVMHKKGKDNVQADALSRLAKLSTNSITSRPRVCFRLPPKVKTFHQNSFPTRLIKRYRSFQRRTYLTPFPLSSILRTSTKISSITTKSPMFHRAPYSPLDIPNLSCQKCNQTSHESSMLICELCSNGFHSHCYPPPPSYVPSEFYYCSSCLSYISSLKAKDPILDFPLLNYLKSSYLPSTSSARERVLHLAKHFYYQNNRFFTFLKNTPKEFPTIVARQQLLFEFHDNTGHPGITKTVNLINIKYHWSSIRSDVAQHIRQCTLCIARKSEFRDSSTLTPLPTGSQPFQYWHVDLLTNLPESPEGFKHILICVDSFSKWPELIPLKSKSSMEVAHGFFRDVICRYGKPLAVRCDNGGEFKDEFSNLLQYISTLQKHTNPNRPRSNGQAERFVRSTINFLRNVLHSNSDSLDTWPLSLPTVLYTLRMSPSAAHSYSPFLIIHGFLPSLIDPLSTIAEGLPLDTSQHDIDSYVSTLQNFQVQAFQKTYQGLQQTAAKSKILYESKPRKEPYSFSNNQLVFKSTGPRLNKLQLSSDGPYIIQSFINDNTVQLLDPSNNSILQSSIYNLIPIRSLKSSQSDIDKVNLEPQPFTYKKRPSTGRPRGRPSKL